MSLPEPNHAAVLVQNHCTSSDEVIVHLDNNNKKLAGQHNHFDKLSEYNCSKNFRE